MIRRSCSGFSLIEIIAVLLLLSVMAGALYSYFISAFVESHKPLEKLQKSHDLHRVMENIISDYTLNYPELQKRQARWQKLTYYYTDPVNHVRTFIRAAGNKGYIYECTVAGKSRDSEPTDFTNGTSPVFEGTLKWERVSDLKMLQDNIFYPFTSLSYDYISYINNNYGIYIVKENKFIKFVWNAADSVYKEEDIVFGEAETILKVTIANDSGEILTSLFINVN